MTQSSTAGAEPLRIAYVVSRWGAPTETFVRREVSAARAAGHEVLAVSLKAPVGEEGGPPVTHPGARTPLLLLRTLLRHPIRSSRVLVRCARRAKRSTLLPNLAAAVTGLAAAAELRRVDWIHAHFAWVAATAADAIAEVRRQPFSVFPHAFDIFDGRFIDGYTRDKLLRAAFVVVESPSIQREVNDRFGCDAGVARMGVPRELVREDLGGRRPDPGRIVSVGSLVPKKGHDVLLRALAELPQSARLTLVGDGPERRALERQAQDLGLAERVHFAGAVPEPEVSSYLDGAEVFCLASRPTDDGDRDGVPNVLIEAMARGVPCVSTTLSGIPDLLGDGRGVLVPPDDGASLATALRRLLDHRDEARRVAVAARDHVDEQYRTDRNWVLLESRIRASRARAAAG